MLQKDNVFYQEKVFCLTKCTVFIVQQRDFEVNNSHAVCSTTAAETILSIY